jgi:GntR family transcriptional regulator/MocR family aminotransferase
MTLKIEIDAELADPLFLQIAARVRAAIATGQLAPGARLPSSRALSAQLGVARGTVDAAYELLAGEGAIASRGSAGTVVSGSESAPLLTHTPYMFQDDEPQAAPATPLPFQLGLPALDAFPRKLWSNLTVQAARSLQSVDFAGADPAGVWALRQEVATYLGIARGIRCSAAQVLIVAGYQGALALVRGVLVRPGDPVWMEDPGYYLTRQALEASGARVVPVRVDREGLRVASGIAAAPKARLAVVTPTHQCPTGVSLSLPRRMALLGWAADAGSWILEDDYDSEFRYAGRPVPSLKSLDRGQRVLYAGTFSKVLSPSLRLGYLVVPPELAPAFQRAIRLHSLGQPLLEQAIVADFMRKGHFARHIRRMRVLYGERRAALAAALTARFGDRVSVEMAGGGMHLLARFPGGGDDTALLKRATAAGLGPSALSACSESHDCGQGLLLSFTNIAVEDAVAAADRLAGALGH